MLTFLLVLPLAAAYVDINEVMYNPDQCSDTICEWIELYNSEQQEVNLSGCTLEGKPISATIPAEGFLIAARNQNNFTQFFGPVGNLVELSFSLGNNGDTVQLAGRNDCNKTFNYTSYIEFADGNNKTLERRSDGSWGESLEIGGTPGRQNSIWNLSTEYHQLFIWEIMPDPFGNDDADKPSGEWVELYNAGDKALDLRGLLLKDSNDDNELYLTDTTLWSGTILCAGCYAIVYRDGDSDFALNNDVDYVRLFLGDELLQQVSYSGSTEGMSVSNIDGQWFHTIATPGEENIFTEQCDWKLSLLLNNTIFQPDELAFTLKVERLYGFAQNITVRGKIEDVFGRVVQEYAPWTNQRITSFSTKDYSPNLKEDIYQVSFWLENVSCADAATHNNRALALVAVNPQYKKNTSSLLIEKLYLGNDDAAEWGDQFTAKVVIYKGDETRYSAQLWAEKDGKKVSKTTSVNLYDLYKEYPLTLPVQLLPNCDEDISGGTAVLILEAFGLREERAFEAGGVDKEVCKDYLAYIKKEEASSGAKISYELLDVPVALQPGEVTKLQVQIMNDDKEHDFAIWGYVYRGNKCYSCFNSSKEREHNLQHIRQLPSEAKVVELLLKLDENMEEGEYNLKVKIRKDAQKTTSDITKTFYVSQEKNKQAETALSILSTAAVAEENQGIESAKKTFPSSGIIVYQSNSEKARRLIPYILIIAFGLLSLVLVLRKK